ncbi:MAG: hypothetical protein ACI8TQ_002860 [Planctomycetota bacterium]
MADESGIVTVNGGITVENLDAGKHVALISLTAAGQSPGTKEGLIVRNNLGAVRALTCIFSGWDEYPRGAPGVALVNNTQVAFTGCVLRGGRGVGLNYYTPNYFSGAGGHGVSSEQTAVAIYNCVVEGSDASPGFAGGVNGGNGLQLISGVNFASGTSFVGGEDSQCVFIISPGLGGHGVGLESNSAAVHLLDADFVPGLGGSCTTGTAPSGVDIFGTGQTVDYQGTARGTAVPSPMRDGQVMPLTFTGEPGDLIFLLISDSLFYFFAQSLRGVQLANTGLVKVQGFIGASGSKTKNIPLNVLAPGMASFEAHLQSIFLDASSEFIWGASTHLIVSIRVCSRIKSTITKAG